VVRGTFRLESSLDLGPRPPSPVAAVVAAATDLVDSPHDPATRLLDHAGDGLAVHRPALDLLWHEVFRETGGVQRVLALAATEQRLVTRVGLVTELEIASSTARHVVTGVIFDLDGLRVERTLAELGLAEIAVPGIGVRRRGDDVELGGHTLGYPFGRVAALAREGFVPPLSGSLDCEAIAGALGELHGPLCDSVVAIEETLHAARFGELANVATFLDLEGEARAHDDDGDGVADRLSGRWWGDAGAGTERAPLGSAIFAGRRVR
jgi:hypothetical protein